MFFKTTFQYTNSVRYLVRGRAPQTDLATSFVLFSQLKYRPKICSDLCSCDLLRRWPRTICSWAAVCGLIGFLCLGAANVWLPAQTRIVGVVWGGRGGPPGPFRMAGPFRPLCFTGGTLTLVHARQTDYLTGLLLVLF